MLTVMHVEIMEKLAKFHYVRTDITVILSTQANADHHKGALKGM